MWPSALAALLHVTKNTPRTKEAGGVPDRPEPHRAIPRTPRTAYAGGSECSARQGTASGSLEAEPSENSQLGATYGLVGKDQQRDPGTAQVEEAGEIFRRYVYENPTLGGASALARFEGRRRSTAPAGHEPTGPATSWTASST